MLVCQAVAQKLRQEMIALNIAAGCEECMRGKDNGMARTERRGLEGKYGRSC